MTIGVFQAGAIIQQFASDSGHSVDACADILSRAYQMDQQSKLDRRATDEEKATIHATVTGLDGELTPQMPEIDILARAGVRNAQGTRSYARREKKIALLTKAS
jgi:hypothetical protein